MGKLLTGTLLCMTVMACTPSGIKVQYARFSGCPEEKIDVIDMGETKAHSSKFRASGCGNGVLYYCRDGRCASPEITVTQRHAKQFGCGIQSVSVESLDGGAWKASGCGHDLTYQCGESDDVVLRCIAETADGHL